jgi:hypothetical protein
MLHLMGFPPAHTALLQALAACLDENDGLVLLDHGLHWLDDPDARDTLSQLARIHQACVYVFGEVDPTPFQPLDPPGLVLLTEQHMAISSWYP